MSVEEKTLHEWTSQCLDWKGAAVEFISFDAEFALKRIISGDVTCFHAVPTIYVKFTQFLEKVPA
eukprot:3471198-Amphidinium_carterae.1